MWVLVTATCPYPGTLLCPLVPCSLLPGTAVVDTCPDWRVSAWTLWGLESSMAGRTKAWPDIQAQNARAKVKKSDRQTDIVVYMSKRGPPVSSLVMATTSWMLALGLGKHRAWCSDWGRGTRCGARPLPMSGDGPENIWKRPLCILLSWSHTGGASSCPAPPLPAPHSSLGSPGSCWPGHWGMDLRDSMSLKALPQAWPCLRQGDTQK